MQNEITPTDYELSLGQEYLGTEEITVEKKTFNDQKFSTKGWQYKQSGGNRAAGQKTYDECIQKYELLKDDSHCARNDSDPRFYVQKIFKIDEKSIVKVSNDPSRSGKSCTWNFTYISTKEGVLQKSPNGGLLIIYSKILLTFKYF